MNSQLHRALARAFKAAIIASLLAVAAARAEAPDPAALELDEAATLAVTAQPLLEAHRQAVRAAQEAGIAAGQLPDPMLVGGLMDLTVTGPDRYTLRTESDTQFVFGIKQSIPGGRERATRRARGAAEAERLGAELGEQERSVRREAGLAWLDAWKATQAQALVTASISEAERQVQAVEIAYRSGLASQAELLAARVSVELLNDSLAGLQQDEWHARNQLRRWIGPAAERQICPDLPAWPAPQEAALFAHLEQHPHLAAQSGAVKVARAEVDLAKSEYSPDWSVEAGYGYRPEFEDFASLQVEIGLPVFTRDRQDRATASRTAELARAESLKEDWLRQHRAEILLNVADWQRLQERFRRYDETILPQSAQRLDAAMSAYATGGGALTAVLDARRSLLDIRMQRLELKFDAARHQVQLQYFAAPGERS